MGGVNLGENFLAGLRAPNYVNGRLLTASDLKADQDAVLARLGFVGKAAGSGVVEGFEVVQAGNNLRISAGLGLNRQGDALRLVEASVELSLTSLPDASSAVTDGGRFNDCQVAPAGGGTLVETGAYLFVVTPVSQMQGSISVKALSTSMATCASQWEVEGIQFKAIRLTAAPVRNANNQGTYRNLLAHWCWGTEALKNLPQDPFMFPSHYGGLDLLSEADLAPCDLPLAVFYWDNQTLVFVDQWSARRRITAPYPTETWHALIADRRVADAQARFLQFQAQLDDLRFQPNPEDVTGAANFRYLPPLGFLPIVPPDFILAELVEDALNTLAGNNGVAAGMIQSLVDETRARIPTAHVFNLETFFGAKLPARIGLADRDTVESWLNQSWFEKVLDFTTFPDVTSPNDDPAPFDVFIIADELRALITGIVQTRLSQNLGEIEVLELGNRFADFGATYTFRTGKLLPTFGNDEAQVGMMQLAGSGRSRRAVRLNRKEFDLTDNATLMTFIQTVQLPPQYAIFVKRNQPVRWLQRIIGD